MKTEGKENELSFLSNDPGASKFGNFINYYSFHNVEERTTNLHADMFPNTTNNTIICLDIGCNTGNLTKEVYSYLQTRYKDCNIEILAVDIDPALIERAQESNDNPKIKYSTANIMETEDQSIIQKYIADHNKTSFDITFCFSVTMWIHINNGDEGLLKFLDFIKNISSCIVIEPQPWKCYRNAQRRLKKSGSLFEYYEGLKIRSDVDDVIEKNILESKFCKLYESPSSSWNRKILSFQKTISYHTV